jgi:hypothetical protein
MVLVAVCERMTLQVTMLGGQDSMTTAISRLVFGLAHARRCSSKTGP